MRYIIIPLLIIFYIIWSYKSIKDTIKYPNYDFERNTWSNVWLSLHIGAIGAIVIAGLFYLIVTYW